MRLLVLMLNIVVGSALLAQSTEILAASESIKANKNIHQRGHATKGKSKANKLLRVKQKKSKNPGDVWVRLRSGMQIPRPKPVEPLPEQVVEVSSSVSGTSVAQLPNELHPTPVSSAGISSNSAPSPESKKTLDSVKFKLPSTATAPTDNYTRYARLKLNSIISSRVRTNLASPEQLLALKNSNLKGLYATQSRLRSRIDLHPELRNPAIKSIAKPGIDSASSSVNPIDTTDLVKTDELVTENSPERIKQQMMYGRVNKHTIWYTQRRDFLYQVAKRAQPYLYHIVDSLSKHKLPYELALLPIVESAYQPTAQSPKSAAGLWQFIPSTGQDFNLQQSDEYDARLDITASTQAAIRYLSFLKQHFHGDWLLALAAYNCGQGTVDNAIKRNLAEGLDTDYWSLSLPEETMEYVPRFLAISTIFSNPAAHGLKLAPVKNEPYFVKVKIERKHDVEYLAEKDFSEVAQLANLSYEQFNRLNPGYLDTKLAANGPFTFLLPAANANQLNQRLTSIAQFLDEPTATVAAHAPLKKRTLFLAGNEKTATSLLTDITVPNTNDLLKVTNPFLSLNMDANQTTPRIANQPVISSTSPYPDQKREKKNI